MYTALLDANVLYPAPVMDLMLELASTGLYRARWSDDIHDEWVRNLTRDHPDKAEAIEKRRDNMDRAIPQALVTGYHDLIEGLQLPDPDDRHVLAAAIVGRADVIVTFNLKDFPDDRLAQYGIEAQHPDEFLNFQRTLDEALFLQCVKAIRSRLTRHKYTADAYIENLRTCHLPVIADELSKARQLI